MNRDRGFSLMELLIVIAIILTLLSIAIPSYRWIRQSAQETVAQRQLQTINTAQIRFSSTHGGNYASLDNLIALGILDSRFAGPMSGYVYAIAVSGSDYTATATPISTNAGRYGYLITDENVIRYQTGTPPNCVPCFPPNEAGRPVGGAPPAEPAPK
jgi:prepilin-type N-terminal cleavage/methylation domain-containing protein